MSADLNDLTESLGRAMNPPGQTVIVLSPDEALGRLQDAFWDARLDGLLSGFVVDDDGIVTPTSGTTDITRDMLQIVVFYAAMNAIYNEIRNIKTMFSAKAGPVSYETQQSANVLRDVAQVLMARKDLILSRLSDVGRTPTYYIDSVVERTQNIIEGTGYFLGEGSDPMARGFSRRGG